MSLIVVAVLLIPAVVVGQVNWRERLMSVPHADSCRDYLIRLTEEPHVAGTEEDEATAEYVLKKFQSFGFHAEMNSYEVYLPFPTKVEFEIVQPIQFTGPTPEAGYAEDKDSFAGNVLPAFNAYSANGGAQSDVVYVNYGLPEDYERLDKLGISVENRIVLARYGKSFRGVKVDLAQQHGASGVLLYSDPADDGYMQGDIFPKGPMRPPTGVQRGSIQYLYIYPGDPLTPGWAATPEARRLAPTQAKNLPRLPCLPISYHDAEKVLTNLAGPNVPKGWQGGLPFAYHVGPGPAEVRLFVESEYLVRPIWNVIATFPGAVEPDSRVIIGNHHDAWTFGAVDPSSGTAALLEIGRAFGELKKQGFRPRRTILFASWDGEEHGLLGSTEWVEHHVTLTTKHTVAYVNMDAAVSGDRFGAGASPTLWPLVQQITGLVPEPRASHSVLRQWWLNQTEEKKKRIEPNWVTLDTLAVEISHLGSGSDYTAFFDFAGVPCISMSFNGKYGVYHSLYDSFYWMSTFGDPAFIYHSTMSKIGGLMVLELANAPMAPIDPWNYAEAFGRELQAVRTSLREEDGSATSLNDLWEQSKAWKTVAKKWRALAPSAAKLEDFDLAALNETLMQLDRAFISSEGLQGRSWYKNLFVAPDKHLGYGALTLPALRECIEEKKWDNLLVEESRLMQCVMKARELTQAAVDLVESRMAMKGR